MDDEQRTAQLRECFGFFERNGLMSLDDLPTALRAMNLNPSERQLVEFRKELDSGNGAIDFVKFKAFMLPQLEEDPDTKDMLLNAFKIFDKNGLGFIQTAELKHVMTGLGERYSDAEFDELVRAVDRDGFIQYDEFADRLLMTYQQLGDELLTT
eukprot:TRINITY_DN8179_c0_g1_i1.p2 TRINITY_DN8179_c0_g1~~TRINITY_DN8179_c0_g1_i1.p2  ORF type:complete len:154 (+),score=72.84 TRINITY_DN8179_c0_g1_i1:57-518(+)